jgi:FKBP-type peptidyl-prolyl cis-trans isomerase FkpA
MKQLLFIFIIFQLVACNTYSDEQKASFNETAAKYAKSKKWKFKESESGLCIVQLSKGTGTEVVKSTSEVTISYKGSLKNGFVFDKTISNKPLVADLRGLIGGMQEGLLNQKKGAKLKLIIPPQLGYGDEKLDKIPANSILIFEIELLDVK